MSIADELLRLEQMRERGSLSEDEFQRAKARLLGSAPSFQEAPAFQAVNGFRRSSSDRWIAGLCGGLGQATGIASWIWRLMFVLLLFAGCAGILVYLLLWLVVPLQLPPPPLARSA
jgi:phage shock protein PspC (stress-responsive transcriptional regulator)